MNTLVTALEWCYCVFGFLTGSAFFFYFAASVTGVIQ